MARKITVAGKSFDIRGLIREETFNLREDHGIVLTALTPSNVDEAQDRVAEIVLSKSALKQYYKLGHKPAGEIFIAVMKETYGAEDEEKNSSASGTGSQTNDE